MPHPVAAAKHGVQSIRGGLPQLNQEVEQAERLVDRHAEEPEQPVNFRDIGELSEVIEQGRVYRSSQQLRYAKCSMHVKRRFHNM